METAEKEEELVNPFLYATEGTEKCLICNKNVGKKPSSNLTSDGWNTFITLAEQWSKLSLPENHACLEFTKIHGRVNGKSEFGKVHQTGNCRPMFGRKTLREKLASEFCSTETAEAVETTTPIATPHDSDAGPSPISASSSVKTRSATGNTKQFQYICFACDTVRPCDSNPYVDR